MPLLGSTKEGIRIVPITLFETPKESQTKRTKLGLQLQLILLRKKDGGKEKNAMTKTMIFDWKKRRVKNKNKKTRNTQKHFAKP